MFEQIKFCKRLSACLEDLSSKGISAKKLSAEIHVDNRSISSYKHGQNLPPIPTLVSLAEKFGVSVDYLLGLVDEPAADADIRAICEKTRLSSAALANLEKTFEDDQGIEIPYYLFELNDAYEALFSSRNVANAILENNILTELINKISTYFAFCIFENAMKSFDKNALLSIAAGWSEDITHSKRQYAREVAGELFESLIDGAAKQFADQNGLNSEDTWFKYISNSKMLNDIQNVVRQAEDEGDGVDLKKLLRVFATQDFINNRKGHATWPTYKNGETKPGN